MSLFPSADFYPLFSDPSGISGGNPGTMVAGWVGGPYFEYASSLYGGLDLFDASVIWLHEGRAYLSGRFMWDGADRDANTGGYAATELLTAPIPEQFRPLEDTDLTLYIDGSQSHPVEMGQSIVLRIRTDGTIGLIGHQPHSEFAHKYDTSENLSWAVVSGATDTPPTWNALPSPASGITSSAEQARHVNAVHLRGDISRGESIDFYGRQDYIYVYDAMPNPPSYAAESSTLSSMLSADDGRRYQVDLDGYGGVYLVRTQPDDAGPVGELSNGDMYKGAWDTSFTEDGYTFHVAEAAGAEADVTSGDDYRYSETIDNSYGLLIPYSCAVGDKAQLVIRYTSAGYYAMRFEIILDALSNLVVQWRVVRVVGGTETVLLGPFVDTFSDGFSGAQEVPSLGGYVTPPNTMRVAEIDGGDHSIDVRAFNTNLWWDEPLGANTFDPLIARGLEGYATAGLTPLRNAIYYTAPREGSFPGIDIPVHLDVTWPGRGASKKILMVVEDD